MSYDALDRNTGLAYPAGTLVTYAFDAAGQQTLMADLTGLTSYSYDRAGRQSAVVYPTGQALTYAFDPAGRRTAMQEASGARSTYTYITQYDGPIFLDDPQGLRTRFDYFGGQVQHSGGYVSGGVASLGQAFLFDAPGQVSAVLTYHLNVPGFAGLGISYDTAGQVRQTTEAGSTRNYAYDAAGQLTGDQLINIVPFQLTFSYDSTGNRLTKVDGAARTTYVYDAANQLQTEKLGGAITTYSYDPNGNRASQITGAAITSFTWDEENRLTAIAYPDATRTTYLYSADGVRQRKIDSTGTVNYLWDETRLLQETDVSLVEIVRYTQGIEGWQTMSSQRRGGVDSFFAYDQIGNTRQLVDITGGVTDTTTYEAFGVERARTGTTVTNVQFGGQFGYIRDLFGLSRAGLRIVDSKTGQWLSRDLIGFDGGDWNLYAYVGNDPVGRIDPSGLRPCGDDSYDAYGPLFDAMAKELPPNSPQQDEGCVASTAGLKVISTVANICSNFRSRIGDKKFIANVNQCYQKGKPCAGRGPQVFDNDLLVQYTNVCSAMNFWCENCKPGTCARRIPWPTGCSIKVCPNNIAAGGCGGFGGVDPFYATLLHEMSHCAYFWHFNATARNCMDVLSCCTLQAFFPKPGRPKC